MNTISEVLGRRVQLKGLIGKRAMKCPYCDFYFMKNGSDLQRHIWAHEGESSYHLEHLFNFVLCALFGDYIRRKFIFTCPVVRISLAHRVVSASQWRSEIETMTLVAFVFHSS